MDMLIIVLAAARLTRLICFDTILDGPRQAISMRSTFFSALLACPWCAGFWVSLATWIWADQLGTFLLVPWAISYAVGVLESYWFD